MDTDLRDHLEGATVLIVVHDDDQRESLRGWFVDVGASVIEARSADAAFRLARDRPDLVLLDAQLGETSTAALIDRLKSDAVTSTIPLIQRSSAPIDDGSVADGLRRGADAYLVEPVSQRVLLATADATLRTQELARRLEVALSSGDSGVFDWNIPTGVVTWNDSLERVHGMVPGEFGGTIDDFYTSVHPHDASALRARVEVSLEVDDAFVLAYRFVRAGGSIGHMESRGRIFRAPDGAPVRMLGLAQDVTNRVTQRVQIDQLRRLASQLSGLRTSAGVLEALGAELVDTNVHLDLVEAGASNADDVVFSFSVGERRLDIGWSERADGVTRRQAIAIGELAGSAIDRALRYEAERTNAEILQRALQPEYATSVGGYRFDAQYLPAERSDRLGGDFFDVLDLDDWVIITVGDVAGHGLEATRQMGAIRSMLRTVAASRRGDPAAIVAECRSLYYAVCGLDCPFSTVIVGRLDKASGRVTLVSAGHPPPLHCARGGVLSSLELVPGPPLGVVADGHTAEVELVLAPGDWLAMYTDGVFERRDMPFDEAVRKAITRLGGVPSAEGLVEAGECSSMTADDRVAVVVERTI